MHHVRFHKLEDMLRWKFLAQSSEIAAIWTRKTRHRLDLTLPTALDNLRHPRGVCRLYASETSSEGSGEEAVSGFRAFYNPQK